jgi:sn-glycerol 3-phosphate transport system substrate-binding protein
MKAYVKEVPESLVALKQAEVAGPFLQVPGYHRVREFLKSGIDRTLAGELKPDAALKQITESSNREIQRLMRRHG